MTVDIGLGSSGRIAIGIGLVARHLSMMAWRTEKMAWRTENQSFVGLNACFQVKTVFLPPLAVGKQADMCFNCWPYIYGLAAWGSGLKNGAWGGVTYRRGRCEGWR